MRSNYRSTNYNYYYVPRRAGTLDAKQKVALEAAGFLFLGSVMALLLLFSPELYKAKRNHNIDIFKGTDMLPDEQVEQRLGLSNF